MPRPKGYKLSEEAKQRIGAASRAKWDEKRMSKATIPATQVSYSGFNGGITEKLEQEGLISPEGHQDIHEKLYPKKKWWQIWK